MYIQPQVEFCSDFIGDRTKELENIDWVQPMVEFVGIFSRWQQYRVNAFCVPPKSDSIQPVVELCAAAVYHFWGYFYCGGYRVIWGNSSMFT